MIPFNLMDLVDLVRGLLVLPLSYCHSLNVRSNLCKSGTKYQQQLLLLSRQIPLRMLLNISGRGRD